MRLHLLLPKVNPEKIAVPSKCPLAPCEGRRFHLHQPVSKALRDTVYQQVEVHRYQCLKCGHTFRVYPEGVSGAQTSGRVKGLAVMLYLLGLSYGAVSLALEAIGVQVSKTLVYETVQEAARRIPDLPPIPFPWSSCIQRRCCDRNRNVQNRVIRYNPALGAQEN